MDDPLQFVLLALALALAVFPFWFGAYAANKQCPFAWLLLLLAGLVLWPISWAVIDLAFSPPVLRQAFLYGLAFLTLKGAACMFCATLVYLVILEVIARPWLIWITYFAVVVGGLCLIVANGGSIPCQYTGGCQ